MKILESIIFIMLIGFYEPFQDIIDDLHMGFYASKFSG